MPDLLSFEWNKCPDGYEILEFDHADLLLDQMEDDNDPLNLTARSGSDTETLLRHHQMGFIRLESKNEEKTRWGRKLLPETRYFSPKSKKLQTYKIDTINKALFMEFAELDGSTASFIDFANEYGLLGEHHGGRLKPRSFSQPLPESTDSWTAKWDFMCYLVKSRQKTRFGNSLKPLEDLDSFIYGRASIKLVPGPDGAGMNLSLSPLSLSDFLEVEFARAVSSNVGLKRCVVCPRWFAFGTGTGRRKSAHYCSDTCRKNAWRKSQQEDAQ